MATVGVLGVAFASEVQSVEKQAVEKVKESETAKVVKEAADVVRETNDVLQLLAEGKKERALELLQKMESQLQKLIETTGLERLPVKVEVLDYTGIEDLKTAEKYNKRVKEVISKNDFVDGRFLLKMLRDEVDIVTTYIPLYLYKEAIDLALNMVKSGNANAAMFALQSALTTLEVETTIIPKPIIKAQYLLEQAQKIYKNSPEQAQSYIKEAEYNLKLAVALGYVPSLESLKSLLEKLENLKKAVETNAATTEEQFKNAKAEMEKFRKETTTVK